MNFLTMGSVIAKFLVLVLVFLAYNEFVIMYRESKFNDLAYQQDSDVILDNMGQPVAMHDCKTGSSPSPLPYADTLCKDNIVKIIAYKHCYVEIRCPGWYYIAQDSNGRMVAKYNLTE